MTTTEQGTPARCPIQRRENGVLGIVADNPSHQAAARRFIYDETRLTNPGRSPR